ncbi:MAG: hypothetical protein ACFBQW_08280 [Sphingomonadaceae bacterium]
MSAFSVKPPAWFWAVATAALLWNLYGVYAYFVQVGMIGTMSDIERTLADATPDWVTGAFATAVFAGALGSLALLLRRGWARFLLILSLIGAAIHQSWGLLVGGAGGNQGTAAIALPAAVILIAIFLVWFSGHAYNRDWIV